MEKRARRSDLAVGRFRVSLVAPQAMRIAFFLVHLTLKTVRAVPRSMSPTEQATQSLSLIAITNEVIETIEVGKEPWGVAVSPDGSTVYVTNFQDDTLSIIQRATNTVTDTIPVGNGPLGLAVAPDGARVYIVNGFDDTVSVIAAATKTLAATIAVGDEPQAIALSPDGAQAYVTNFADNSVSVLNLTTNTFIGTVFVGEGPDGIAAAPDGKKVYVVNYGDNEGGTVSAIDVVTRRVTRNNHSRISPDKSSDIAG